MPADAGIQLPASEGRDLDPRVRGGDSFGDIPSLPCVFWTPAFAGVTDTSRAAIRGHEAVYRRTLESAGVEYGFLEGPHGLLCG
jgi:hypothetical protein